MAKAAPTPIIPANPADRTGTAGLRRRAGAAIRRRFAGLLRDVLDIFGRIRIIGANDAGGMLAERTIYALTPDELAAVSRDLADALRRWIVDERDPAHLFWWAPYDAEASQAGAAQSVMNLTRLSPAYAAARTLQTVLFSEPYRNRVAMAQIKSYEHWTGLAASLRADLAQVIGRAVVDGKSPRVARAEIAARIGVSQERALQYAQTDITDTLRQARMEEAARAEADFGLRLGLLWTSALTPTTRSWHASRHGRAYTRAEVTAFYGQRGNRYNCHCSITETLLDEDGAPMLSRTGKASMAAEKAKWERQHEAP